MTAFTQAFLSPANINTIQDILTHQLSSVTENPDMPRVEMTAALSTAAELFAEQYRAVPPSAVALLNANLQFSEQMLSQNEARYYETTFWRRWCSQGIPDPNNIPLPLAPERADFTIETDDYMLSNPIRYTNFPMC
jgi:hypothetical protein